MSDREPRRPRALIFGCAGIELTDAERDFFAECDPLGFILFARNVADPEQVRRLVSQLRSAVARSDAPVLIDQEGGRVARLRPPHWREAPAAARFGDLARRNLPRAVEAARLNGRLLAAELRSLEINVDCAPVADLPSADAHDVIGDRAFSRDVGAAVALARATAEGLLAGGVLPVVKHIPGHGRARTDSHHELPVVAATVGELRGSDFAVFRALNDLPWAMTAHVVYGAVDNARPATVSPVVIAEIIRGEIGFEGLLISDDLSMSALSGPPPARAEMALIAGCDVALHCNGRLAEMRDIAAVVPLVDEAAMQRLRRGELARRRDRAYISEDADRAASGQLQAFLTAV